MAVAVAVAVAVGSRSSSSSSSSNRRSSTCETTRPRRTLPVPFSSTLASPMMVLSIVQRHHAHCTINQ